MRLFKSVMLVSLMAFYSVSFAQARFVEGVHYEVVHPSQPTRDASKVEVLEFFWYGCPHCYHFEPTLASWLDEEPAGVDFHRVPALFRNVWQVHAKAYFAAEFMGVLDKVHTNFFKAIHENNQYLTTEDALTTFFENNGVSGEDFMKTYQSFGVAAKLKNAANLAKNYKITAVPTMVINGKYVVHGGLVREPKEMLAVVKYLVAQEQQANIASQ